MYGSDIEIIRNLIVFILYFRDACNNMLPAEGGAIGKARVSDFSTLVDRIAQQWTIPASIDGHLKNWQTNTIYPTNLHQSSLHSISQAKHSDA